MTFYSLSFSLATTPIFLQKSSISRLRQCRCCNYTGAYLSDAKINQCTSIFILIDILLYIVKLFSATEVIISLSISFCISAACDHQQQMQLDSAAQYYPRGELTNPHAQARNSNQNLTDGPSAYRSLGRRHQSGSHVPGLRYMLSANGHEKFHDPQHCHGHPSPDHLSAIRLCREAAC